MFGFFETDNDFKEEFTLTLAILFFKIKIQ